MNAATKIAVIGGGLAGCEAAFALASEERHVTMFEMKPDAISPAHVSEDLAELVCSNSFRSDDPDAAVGRLKAEMRVLGSMVMRVAEETRVPAGKALAVDREQFGRRMTELVSENKHITVLRREITSLDDPALADFAMVIIAAGPLASESLSQSLMESVGQEHLYFYDAIAPIIDADSVNLDVAFWGSRYGDGDEADRDYLNCPMSEEEYTRFRDALLAAEQTPTRDFEKEQHFEGCLPIEELAARGEQTMAFGPLKPVGFTDPRTGERPYALLQLRAENQEKTTFNLVGCQTKLKYPEQKRVFRLIPGLENVEFVRMGSVHRNTFVNAPRVLTKRLELKARPGFYLAGQITGVEGYVESAACGLWLGLMLAAELDGAPLPYPPELTAIGALMAHLQREVKNFQPSNVNYGLMPPLNRRAPKKKRKVLYGERSLKAFKTWLETLPFKTS